MTARKAPPETVTAPVIPANEAFGNVITAARDAAVVEAQKLESQRAARQGQYERDRARLDAEWQLDSESLDDQIGRQLMIQEACDAALPSLVEPNAGANVVPLRQAGE